MKICRYLFLLMILLGSFVSRAQKDTFVVRTKFANQGEQEDYWAEQFFYEHYQTEVHPKYSGPVQQQTNSAFRFDSTVVVFLNDRDSLAILFKSGLLYPGLFTGSSYTGDTLRIDALEELKFLKLPPTRKRFRLWCYGRRGFPPSVFLFELTNERAAAATSLRSFLTAATLTFIKKGWVIM